MQDKTYLRVNVSRANKKLTEVIGKPQYYYIWGKKGYFVLVENSQLEKLLCIKGVTKARQNQEFWLCWC
jgi:hypothetical protein